MSPEPIELARFRKGAEPYLIVPGLGSGDSGGMDLAERVGRLEVKVDGLIKDVAEIKGRVSAMPSTWQLFGLNIGLAVAVGALILAVVRFVAP